MTSSAPAYLVELRIRKAQVRHRRWLPLSLGVFLILELGCATSSDGLVSALALACYAWFGWAAYRMWAASTAVADFNRPGVNQEIFTSPLKAEEVVDTIFLLMLKDGLRCLGLPILALSLLFAQLSLPAALLSAVLWVLVVAFMAACMLSCQCWSVRMRPMAAGFVPLLLYGWMIAGMVVFKLSEGWPWLWLPEGLAGLAAMAWVIRRTMIEGVARSSEWEARLARLWRAGAHSAPSRSWLSDLNPVLGRALRNTLRGRLARVLLLLFCLCSASVGLVMTETVDQLCSARMGPVFPFFVFQISVALMSAASWQAYRQVQAEREGGSLDLLRGTRLSPAACVDAWALTGAGLCLTGPTLALLVASPALVRFSPWLVAGCTAIPYLLAMAGGYLGLNQGLRNAPGKFGLQGACLSLTILILLLTSVVILIALPNSPLSLVGPSLMAASLLPIRRQALNSFREAPAKLV